MSRGVPVDPRRVFGVDFSGARDAGRHIWICRGHPGDKGVRIESVDPLSWLPGGAVERRPALRALVQKILDAPRSVWGFDFPFALPRRVVEALWGERTANSWETQLQVVAAVGQPSEFRRLCLEGAGGRELRRSTDEQAATPFSAYNMRLYKQTYYGMTEVLQPLRGRFQVAVLPLDSLPAPPEGATGDRSPANVMVAPARLPHIYILEVCPASLLKALGYLPELGGYKGHGGKRADRRRAILQRLIGDGLVRPVTRAVRIGVIEDIGGDGVDAILAAVGAWRGYRHYDHTNLSKDPRYAVEGYVYR